MVRLSRSHLTDIFHVYKFEVGCKEPTHYSKRVGHEVPSGVAVLCECMGGYREGEIHHMGLSVPFTYHLALLCAKVVKKRIKLKWFQDSLADFEAGLELTITIAERGQTQHCSCSKPLKLKCKRQKLSKLILRGIMPAEWNFHSIYLDFANTHWQTSIRRMVPTPPHINCVT